jgi:hypothetical protein
MRSFPFVALALTCGLSAPAAGQTGSQSNLVLTIFGGAVAGHSLWTVSKQPLCVLDASNVCTAQDDTLRLSRSIGSSVVVGASATYFISPLVALHAELSFLGLPVESHCAAVGSYSAEPQNKNQQVCNSIQALTGAGGAITAFGGVTLRGASRRALSPYLRGNLGLVSHSHSTTDMVGVFIDTTGGSRAAFVREVVADPKPGQTSVMLGAAVGFTSAVGTGYQFRLEVRDLMTDLERLTGPANAQAVAPTASRFYHHIALTIGLDVVLERKRGRRY